MMNSPCTTPTIMATPSVSSEASIDSKLRWADLLRPVLAVVAPCYSPLLFSCRPAETPTVTGTIICSTNNRVSFCIQEDSGSFPFIILDLPITTSKLSGLMRCSDASIVLQRAAGGGGGNLDGPYESVLRAAWWAMHCNGQRMGFAVRREVTEIDMLLLETIRTVATGVGILPGKTPGVRQCTYLRGQFERAVASDGSEAYYLIDPSSSGIGQALSIFFPAIQ